MKKFILGLICGMALLTATAAAASSEIRALLFPVQVQFMINGEGSTLGSDEVQVLNYKDRLYVPLRSFAEQMGSAVYFYGKLPGESKARVELFYEDDRNFTHKDKDGYVRMTNLKYRILGDFEAPDVTGTIKFDKKLPQGKDIVIALLNKDGKQVALSEAIQLRNQEISKMDAGDMAAFTALFPYHEPLDEYKLEIRLVDRTAWTFKQYYAESFVTGAGGMNGYPLALQLDSRYPNKAGEPIELNVMLMNLNMEDSVVITDPVAFEINVQEYVKDHWESIRTLKTEPFSGIVHWKKGTVNTTVIWDGKDNSGKALSPKGVYSVEIKLPVDAKGTMLSKPDTVQTFKLESSMRTRIPIEYE